MLSMNLLHVDGIVICSGDGLVYEVSICICFDDHVTMTTQYFT